MAKAQRPQIVEAENMVGMGVRVEDSIHMPDLFAQSLVAEVRTRIDQDRMLADSTGSRWTGGSRTLRGSAEVQTWQWQPSVGTPIEVPLPRMTISACKRLLRPLGRILRLLRDGIRDLQKHHAQLEERIL